MRTLQFKITFLLFMVGSTMLFAQKVHYKGGYYTLVNQKIFHRGHNVYGKLTPGQRDTIYMTAEELYDQKGKLKKHYKKRRGTDKYKLPEGYWEKRAEEAAQAKIAANNTNAGSAVAVAENAVEQKPTSQDQSGQIVASSQKENSGYEENSSGTVAKPQDASNVREEESVNKEKTEESTEKDKARNEKTELEKERKAEEKKVEQELDRKEKDAKRSKEKAERQSEKAEKKLEKSERKLEKAEKKSQQELKEELAKEHKAEKADKRKVEKDLQRKEKSEERSKEKLDKEIKQDKHKEEKAEERKNKKEIDRKEKDAQRSNKRAEKQAKKADKKSEKVAKEKADKAEKKVEKNERKIEKAEKKAKKDRKETEKSIRKEEKKLDKKEKEIKKADKQLKKKEKQLKAKEAAAAAVTATNVTTQSKSNNFGTIYFKIDKERTEVDSIGRIKLYFNIVNNSNKELVLLKPNNTYNSRVDFFVSDVDCQDIITEIPSETELKEIEITEDDYLVVQPNSISELVMNGNYYSNLECSKDDVVLKIRYNPYEIVEQGIQYNEAQQKQFRKAFEKITRMKIESENIKFELKKQ